MPLLPADLRFWDRTHHLGRMDLHDLLKAYLRTTP